MGEINSGASGCNIAIGHESDDIYNAFEMVASKVQCFGFQLIVFFIQ